MDRAQEGTQMEDLSRRIFLSAAAALGTGVVSGRESEVAQSSTSPQQQGIRSGSSRPGQRRSWNPKLGILANFSQANVLFAKQQGFTSIGLFAHYKTTLDLSSPLPKQRIDEVKRSIKETGLYLSVIGCHQPNHIAADSTERARSNEYFVRAIQLAGELGAPFVGTCSGKIEGRPLKEQVDEIVRVYTDKYFPACQEHHVRILWEPYAGGPNVATGPVGYEQLFKAFGDSPYVGLQYDPSHLVWQMMDPIQTARDFADKIYDVHLKDTEIQWPILRRVGIQPWNQERWWRFRLPGSGGIEWKQFFTVLMESGYQGAMNIEHEDPLYYPNYSGEDFTPNFKSGFVVAQNFLRQFVPV
jgi:sugar phosphate isomerase/epimerase